MRLKRRDPVLDFASDVALRKYPGRRRFEWRDERSARRFSIGSNEGRSTGRSSERDLSAKRDFRFGPAQPESAQPQFPAFAPLPIERTPLSARSERRVLLSHFITLTSAQNIPAKYRPTNQVDRGRGSRLCRKAQYVSCKIPVPEVAGLLELAATLNEPIGTVDLNLTDGQITGICPSSEKSARGPKGSRAFSSDPDRFVVSTTL